jgi:hypothetical protein
MPQRAKKQILIPFKNLTWSAKVDYHFYYRGNKVIRVPDFFLCSSIVWAEVPYLDEAI